MYVSTFSICTYFVWWRSHFFLLRKWNFPFTTSIRVIISTHSCGSKALYTRAHRMVREPLANSLQTKCAYLWMVLWTCTAPSTNGPYTVCGEPKFVVFLHEHKENWMRLHALGLLCSPQVHGKLINDAPLMRPTRMVQRVSGTLVYTKLKTWNNLRTILCTCVELGEE